MLVTFRNKLPKKKKNSFVFIKFERVYSQVNFGEENHTVYTTTSCPMSKSEWDKRSLTINCTDTNGYMCLPNDEFTELLEFCFKLPRIGITKGKHK